MIKESQGSWDLAIWVFGSVVIFPPKKIQPLYEGVGSIPKIFKIYVCVSLD
jgi:hypothetical protein